MKFKTFVNIYTKMMKKLKRRAFVIQGQSSSFNNTFYVLPRIQKMYRMKL